MKKSQLEFVSILNDAFSQYEKRIAEYIHANREVYEANAKLITPSPDDADAIFARIAFAILSANAPFDDSVKALNVVLHKRKKREAVKSSDIVWYKQVPAKAKFINALGKRDMDDLLRFDSESWHDYRMRLKTQVKGLGLAKASFAAALLYPNEADVACIDTWMQKVFLGHTGFKSLSLTDYLYVEGKVRTYANVFGCSTFLAQWMIWDFARGGKVNSHAIFPGSHKNERGIIYMTPS